MALGDSMGSVLGWFSLPPPSSGTYLPRLTPPSPSQLQSTACFLVVPENAEPISRKSCHSCSHPEGCSGT